MPTLSEIFREKWHKRVVIHIGNTEMSFKKFCYNNGYFTKNSDEATHLFMDGGKLKVPIEEYPKFLKKYHKSIISQEPISLVEKVGKNCEMRFFMDIDKCTNIDDILSISKDVVQSDDFTVYKCNENKGIHIVFNIVVNHTKANEIIDNIIDKLPSSLSKYIDKSVYNTGLRMVGSVKATNGETQHRYYLPLGKQSIEELTLLDVKKSIIRLKTLNSFVKKDNTVQSDRFNMLYKYITKIHPNYGDTKFTTCKTIEDYYCINTNSKFCCNLEADHKSVGIYFVLSPKNELYQKCFCTCRKSTCRKHGFCCEFKSKKVKVPSEIYKSIEST